MTDAVAETAVVDAGPEPLAWAEAEARFQRHVARAEARERWASFGTIGFEAYRQWVLEQAR